MSSILAVDDKNELQKVYPNLKVFIIHKVGKICILIMLKFES